jgi:hypothetical protein
MNNQNNRNFFRLRYDLIESKKLDNLTLYVYLLALANQGKLKNTCKFTIKELVELCGYVLDRHTGKSIDKIKSILKVLCDKGLLAISENIDELKTMTLFEATVNELGLCVDYNQSFAVLEDYEFRQLFSKHYNTRAEMLRCFLAIKGRMFSYGSVKISNLTISKIKKILQISNDLTICNIIDKLVDLEMLYVHQLFSKTKSGLTIKKNFYSITAFDSQMKKICYGIAKQEYLGSDEP